MQMPFTSADFFDVFRRYNEGVWPAQLLFLAGAVGAVFAAYDRQRSWSRSILTFLGLLWLWMGAIYQFHYFSAINPIAVIFSAMFLIQGIALLGAAVNVEVDRIRPGRDFRSITGLSLVGYSLIVYPVIGYLAGHRFPATPTFGLPCPTTIFTIGVLLWLRPALPSLFIIPVLWAMVGSAAAIQLSVLEDGALALAVLLLVPVVIGSRRSMKTVAIGLSVCALLQGVATKPVLAQSSTHDLQRVKLESPATYDGIHCGPTGRASAAFYPSGRLESCPLEAASVVGGHALPRGSWVYLEEDGHLRSAWLSHDTKLGAITCKGDGFQGWSVTFDRDGNVRQCYLARSQVIDGVPCREGSFLGEITGGVSVTFHANGRLESCGAGRDVTIGGQTFRKRDRVQLNPDGTPRRTE
jgi:hypothetical protein